MSRAEGVRVGPDAGGGEYVHRAPQGRAHQAISLHHPGQPRWGRHPRQPTIPQRLCSYSRLPCDSVPLGSQDFLASGWGLNIFFWVILQHDLTHPVKTDSSFWTIGVVELIALEHLLHFFWTWTVDIDFCSISDIFARSVLEIVVRLVQAVCAYNCQIGTVLLPINKRVNWWKRLLLLRWDK